MYSEKGTGSCRNLHSWAFNGGFFFVYFPHSSIQHVVKSSSLFVGTVEYKLYI